MATVLLKDEVLQCTFIAAIDLLALAPFIPAMTCTTDTLKATRYTTECFQYTRDEIAFTFSQAGGTFAFTFFDIL